MIVLSENEIERLEKQMLTILSIPVDSLPTKGIGTSGNIIHSYLSYKPLKNERN